MLLAKVQKELTLGIVYILDKLLETACSRHLAQSDIAQDDFKKSTLIGFSQNRVERTLVSILVPPFVLESSFAFLVDDARVKVCLLLLDFPIARFSLYRIRRGPFAHVVLRLGTLQKFSLVV